MTGYLWTAWLWWIGAAALGLAGLSLLYWSLLKDRARGRRRCPKCWYNMSGTQSMRCSECGSETKSEREFRKTRRRWRWVFVALLSFAGSFGLTYPQARDFNWNTIKPLFWLKRQGEADSPQGLAAREELVRRLTNELVSQHQIQDVVEYALAIQADPTAYWSGPNLSLEGTWGTVIETAWDKGWLSQEQVGRYTQTAFGQSFTVQPRATIRSGAPLPVRFQTGPPRVVCHLSAEPQMLASQRDQCVAIRPT